MGETRTRTCRGVRIPEISDVRRGKDGLVHVLAFVEYGDGYVVVAKQGRRPVVLTLVEWSKLKPVPSVI